MKLRFFLLLLLTSSIACAAPNIIFTPTTFKDLPGWNQGEQQSSLITFQKSCVWVLTKPQNTPFKNAQTVCAAALATHPKNNAQARAFFEKYFTPALVSTGTTNTGLFTGYYIPTLQGSLTKQKDFQVPVYGRPHDLTTLTHNQQTEYGHWVDGEFKPYPPRADIEKKGIAAPIVLWLKNPVDLFFLQVQGSGLVELENGRMVQLAFDGKNGQPYTAIGKLLIAEKYISPANVSMQSIKTWLEAHPKQAQVIMNQNASYIFFKLKTDDIAPKGAIGVSLTPERSLAVDNRFIPYGVPLWLSTTVPVEGKNKPFEQLLIAQDTGSAIQGAIRGDVFWGDGSAAEKTAGAMQSTGQYWILIPKTSMSSSPT